MAPGGGLSPLSPSHRRLLCVPLPPSAPHWCTQGIRHVSCKYPVVLEGGGGAWRCHGGGSGTPGSHLLEVPQGLRLGEGTHLQVPEETCLHQGTRLGLSTRGAMGPPRLSRRGVLVTLTPRPILGSWEGARASGSQMSKAVAPHTACLRDVTGKDAGTPRGRQAAGHPLGQCMLPGRWARERGVRGTGGALGVSYPPCSWLRGARLACRRCRGLCGEEYTAMSRMASGVQPPGSPMHHPAAVPEEPGRAVGDFTMGDFTKGSAWLRLLQSLPPRVGCKRLVGTVGGAAEVSSQHQAVTQKPARGGGQTPGKAKPLCLREGAWGVGVHACVCMHRGTRVSVHTLGCTRVFPQPAGICSECKDTRPWGLCRWRCPFRSTLAPLAALAGPPEPPQHTPAAPGWGSGCWQ